MEELAKVTQQNRIDVQKFYNTNPEKIKKQINILREWIRQQRHLPHNQDDKFLENILLRNKFRIQETKSKLENYYTLKGQYREFFENDYQDYIPSSYPIIGAPVPILGPDLGRVYIIKWRKHNIDDFDVMKIIRLSILALELLLINEYSKGEYFLLDFEGLSFEHLKKLNVVEMQKMFKLYERAFSGRILSIDVINAPNIMTILMPILKLVLSEKFHKKIRIHTSNESVVKFFGKDYLTSDYGGNVEDIQTLQSKWDKIYEEKQDYFKFCANNVANEKLRVGGVRQDNSFGVDGTFQRLNID